jgi:hypothetical protein
VGCDIVEMEGNCTASPTGVAGNAADTDVELVKWHCGCRLFEEGHNMQCNDTARIHVVQIPRRAYTASPYCFIVIDRIQALFLQDNFKPNAMLFLTVTAPTMISDSPVIHLLQSSVLPSF